MNHQSPQPASAATESPRKSIYQIMHDVIDAHEHEDIPVGELIRALHEKGFGLLMMIMVLPNCVPIPIPPGGSTVFSIPLLFLSIPMLLGRPSPWLPAWIRKKHISRSFMLKLLNTICPYISKVETRMRKRLPFMFTPLGERVVGLFWLVFSISIAVPLPMTNFLPGIGILLSALGLLGGDGYAVLAGLGIGILGILLTTGILMVGSDALLMLFR